MVNECLILPTGTMFPIISDRQGNTSARTTSGLSRPGMTHSDSPSLSVRCAGSGEQSSSKPIHNAMNLLPRFAESLMATRPAMGLILKGWSQFNFAHDEQGAGADASSPLAVSWCAFGAIYAAYGQAQTGPIRRLCDVVDRSPSQIPGWNDDVDRTHDDVIQAFYAAGI